MPLTTGNPACTPPPASGTVVRYLPGVPALRPPPNANGQVDTDTGIEYNWDGTTWHVVPGGSGDLATHIADPEPHPPYDDIPTLTLIFESQLI